MSGFIPLWPERASAYAAEVDLLVVSFTLLIVLLSAPVFILIVVFAVRYRRGRSADRARPSHTSLKLEIAWATVPFVLLLGFFVWATWLYVGSKRVPAGAIEIAVLARQWMWKFEHPGGQSEINDLHLPAGEDIVLTMTSEDVIHSLYVPALRLKQDVLPGRYTTLWFNADTPGTYALACAEFCGTDHSVMGGRLIVMAPEAYADWLQARDAGPSLAAQGEDLYRSFGCSGCHEPGGPVRAPDLRGLFGSPAPLADGRVAIADEQYIRDSILLPNLHIAAGYEPIMPSFDGLIEEDEMLRLVAYIKSLGTRGTGEAP